MYTSGSTESFLETSETLHNFFPFSEHAAKRSHGEDLHSCYLSFFFLIVLLIFRILRVTWFFLSFVNVLCCLAFLPFIRCISRFHCVSFCCLFLLGRPQRAPYSTVLYLRGGALPSSYRDDLVFNFFRGLFSSFTIQFCQSLRSLSSPSFFRLFFLKFSRLGGRGVEACCPEREKSFTERGGGRDQVVILSFCRGAFPASSHRSIRKILFLFLVLLFCPC